ncbi:MAG: AAA family ATPase [Lysobacteraceae bacterium]
MTLALFIAGLLFGVVLTLWLRRPPGDAPASRIVDDTATAAGDAPALAPPADDAPETGAPADTAPPGADMPAAEPAPAEAAPIEDPLDRLHRLRREIEAEDERIQRPEDIAGFAQFREGVALLSSPVLSPREVLELLEGDGYVLASMVYAALPARPDIAAADAFAASAGVGRYPAWYMLDYLRSRDDAAALPAFLRHVRKWWWDAPPLRKRMRETLEWAGTHAPGTAAMAVDTLDDHELQQLAEGLKVLQAPVLAPYLAQVEAEAARRNERRTLGGIGRIWTPAPADDGFGIVDHPVLERQLDRLHDLLLATPPVSVLVAGESGSGKTVLVDRLFARLRDDGWLLFEASAAEVLAGQKYIGELEERMRDLLVALDRPKALWRVQDFHDLLHKGAHSQDPRGLLDLLLPALERGRLRMIGELSPAQLAQLLLVRPALRHLAKTVTLAAPSNDEMRDLLARWRTARETALGATVADARTLDEAQRMAAQFFPDQHEPGRSLRLLEDGLRTAVGTEPRALPLTPDALLQGIARRSGLPLEVIDDRQSLDLDTLRAFFRRRVLGQDEAVDCLVDRIAMLKAGLVDPGRPIGVFLFAGPTGTGKTELAKALGELLFGSAERLLRLDMSEYQSEDSAWRLTEVSRDGSTRSLVERIREQPFSVVLLDEFEKAHPKVWDLFLQVFDDGRLGDRSGNVADFRHSIVILTSNVGSTLSRGAGPGFTAVAGGWSRGVVEKALFETFRREFLNRLDRIVLFQPLDRTLMREILHKELQRAMTRRGLRNRDWAVEWEPSAIEFLLDRGFTPDLGARPLRRAIEQHLLAPLARSIVEHRTPKGDQFLFVRSAGDRLEVEFVDPNAAIPPSSAPAAAITTEAGGDPRALVYAPEASPAAIATLHAAFARIDAALADEAWATARDDDYATMQAPDFWSVPQRFVVLDRIERRHRIEDAFDTAQRLDARLARDGADAGFIGHHAQLLWLMQLAVDAMAAQRPQDALLWLAAGEADLKRDPARARRWWQQLFGMYMAWGERRNMRVDVLAQDTQRGRVQLAVSGFGALALLEAEHGLHVVEEDGDDGVQRVVCAVRVAADLPGRTRPAQPPADEELRICRRYRAAPSPLVRDAVRGWRTGRIDRVLAGDFDTITDE